MPGHVTFLSLSSIDSRVPAGPCTLADEGEAGGGGGEAGVRFGGVRQT